MSRMIAILLFAMLTDTVDASARMRFSITIYLSTMRAGFQSLRSLTVVCRMTCAVHRIAFPARFVRTSGAGVSQMITVPCSAMGTGRIHTAAVMRLGRFILRFAVLTVQYRKVQVRSA